jgi:uncharacterized phage infection (PIP) family protein YhgE
MPDAPAATETATTDQVTETETETETEQPTTGEQATETGQTTEDDGAKDPRVTRANSEAARYRTERNALQQQVADLQTQQQAMLAGIAKAAGIAPEASDEADPAAQVGQLTTQVETLTSERDSLKAELLVHTVSRDPELGADPVALLDSRKFTDALAKLDPSAEDYRDKVAEAIKAAVDASPAFRAQGQVPSAGGAETAGQGAGSGAAVTAEQFKDMSYADRSELHRTNPALYRQLAGS